MTNNASFADDLARRISNHFKEPADADPDYEEVRGWYHFDGDTRYLVHEPRTDSWTCVTSHNSQSDLDASHKSKDNSSGNTAQAILAVPACDALEIAETMAQLSMLPIPPLPMEVDRPSQTEPFVYEGWLFAWYFFPEIKRWTLAPVKRRHQ